MIMMEQCHSGGFNIKIIAKPPLIIQASLRHAKNLTIQSEELIFDPFARDWIAAMTGHDPYGHALSFNPDSNTDGRISAQEAFDYVNTIHDPYDTPVFNFKNKGRECALGRDLIVNSLYL